MSASGLAAHLSPAELGQRYRAARSPVERSHLQIVWLLSRGRSEREVARVTGYGRRWVGEVARRYDEGGPDGLGDRRRGNVGARPLLGAEDEAALRAALSTPPADGGLWTGPKVAAWMAIRLGREVWPQRGWDYLKKLGYSGPGHGTPRRRAPRSRRRTKKAGRPGGQVPRGGAWAAGRGLALPRAPARPEAGAAPAMGAQGAAADRGRATPLRVALPLRLRPPGHGRGRLVRVQHGRHRAAQRRAGGVRRGGRGRRGQADRPRPRQRGLARQRRLGGATRDRAGVPAALHPRAAAGRAPVAAGERGRGEQALRHPQGPRRGAERALLHLGRHAGGHQGCDPLRLVAGRHPAQLAGALISRIPYYPSCCHPNTPNSPESSPPANEANEPVRRPFPPRVPSNTCSVTLLAAPSRRNVIWPVDRQK